MWKVICRMMYKYWVVGICLMIYTGFWMLTLLDFMTGDQKLGLFYVVSGVALLWSEWQYIKQANE